MNIIQQPLGDAGPLDTQTFEPKLVLHTTEGLSYPGPVIYHGTHPHFTCDIKRRRVYQHCGMDRAAMALLHPAGTIETNHANAVQIELVTKAALIRTLTDEDYAFIHRLIVHVHHGHGMPLRTATPWGQARFSDKKWRTFAGICGHMHVPHNDHTDPGQIKVRKLV